MWEPDDKPQDAYAAAALAAWKERVDPTEIGRLNDIDKELSYHSFSLGFVLGATWYRELVVGSLVEVRDEMVRAEG
jgi:hypothetical protein